MTITETAKAIRNELKTAGFNTKRVSVRSNSAVRITVKDLTASKEVIEAIAKKYEEYQTDYATGEILCGGNTFVFVEYDWRLMSSLQDSIMPELEAASEGTDYFTARGIDTRKYGNGSFDVYVNDRVSHECNLRGVARAIAYGIVGTEKVAA